MELVPELLVLQGHLWIVLDIIVLRRGHPRREPTEREAREHALVAGGGGEGVGGAEGRVGGAEGARPRVEVWAGQGQEGLGEGHVGCSNAGRHS